MFQDRWYQTEAHNAFFDFIMNVKGNPITAIPTGAGKSVIIARVIESIFKRFTSVRVMMLTHVGKLVKQNVSKIKDIWPHAPVGIYAAKLKRRDIGFPITAGTIQSVWKKMAKDSKAFGKIDLLIVDECHLVNPDEDTMYAKLYAEFLKLNPNMIVWGLSATPYRMKLGELVDGGIFTHVCYDLTSFESFNRLVSEGFLAPLVSRPTSARIDTSAIKLVAGEFVASQSEIEADRITAAAVQEVIYWGQHEQRRACLVFAAGVDNAERIADCFRSFGVDARTCHSKKSDKENDAIMEAFENGEFMVLVSMMKLTTGYDYPSIDLIADLQPTNSPGLHVQKAGRGTRTAAGKINCRYLDFAGNIERNGPINDPVKPRKPGEKGAAPPIKICGQCGAYNHASAGVCGGKDWRETLEGCGHPFPPPEVEEKLRAQASEAAIMREEKKAYQWIEVHRVLYSKFQSARTGQPPSLKVRYIAGVKEYDELVRVEHGGKMSRLANEWWARRGSEPMPTGTDRALEMAPQVLRIPKRIMVETSGKYPEVVDYEF